MLLLPLPLLQTLGKCAKMIPVMIWGTIIMRKKYGAYCCCAYCCAYSAAHGERVQSAIATHCYRQKVSGIALHCVAGHTRRRELRLIARHDASLPLPLRCPCGAGPKDYLNALLITLGCSLFLMTGSVKSKHAGADSSLFGLSLMLGYLGFDGFTSTFQDKLFKASRNGVRLN